MYLNIFPCKHQQLILNLTGVQVFILGINNLRAVHIQSLIRTQYGWRFFFIAHCTALTSQHDIHIQCRSSQVIHFLLRFDPAEADGWHSGSVADVPRPPDWVLVWQPLLPGSPRRPSYQPLRHRKRPLLGRGHRDGSGQRGDHDGARWEDWESARCWVECVAGYQTRQQAQDRLVKTLTGLLSDWPRETFSGFMVHFTNRKLEALRWERAPPQ